MMDDEKEEGCNNPVPVKKIGPIYKPEWLDLLDSLFSEQDNVLFDLHKIYPFPFGKTARYLSALLSRKQDGLVSITFTGNKHPNGMIVGDDGSTPEELSYELHGNLRHHLDRSHVRTSVHLNCDDGAVTFISLGHTEKKDDGIERILDFYQFIEGGWYKTGEGLSDAKGVESALENFALFKRISEQPKTLLPMTRGFLMDIDGLELDIKGKGR